MQEIKEPVIEEKQEEKTEVAAEEPAQEVKEPVVEEKQEEKAVVVAEEPVQEAKEPVVEEKQEEKAVVVAEEPVQEAKEPVVEEKQEEKTEVAVEEPVQEVKQPVVEEKQEEKIEVAAEEPVQEVKEPVVEEKHEEKIEVAAEEPVQEVKEPVAVEEKQEEKTEVAAEEPVQEVREPVVEEKQEENTVVAAEEPVQEKEQPIVALKKEEDENTSKEPIRAEIANMGTAINSTFPDYLPLVTADGSTMIFTSRRPTDPKDIQKGKVGKENIYITHFDNRTKKWSQVEMLEPSVNIPGQDNSAIALSNDGQRLLIYRNEEGKNGEIYESVLYGDVWSDPVKLPSPINSDENETSASISPDGRTIFFISDRKGGIGGKDIWFCSQDKAGKWGEAINAGELINTTEDEESIFIHPNGNSLFFSSKGNSPIGGHDIFMSVLNEATGKWANPKNLGSTINTSADDLNFVMAANGKTAYYTSFEANGGGGNDIYSVTLLDEVLKKNTVLLKGIVIDENGRFLKSKVAVVDKSTDKIIGVTSSNRALGKYQVSLPVGKSYDVKFLAKGYTAFVEPVETTGKAGYNELSKIILLESKNAFILARLIDEGGNPIIAQAEVLDKASRQIIDRALTIEEGYSRISVPSGKNCGVIYSKPGYLFQTFNVAIPNAIGYEKNLKSITLQRIEEGKKIVLNNVFFESGQTILKQEFFTDLDLVEKLMFEMPSLQVEISDHANYAGDKSKQVFSKERAKSVVDYLIYKGVDPARLKSASYEVKGPVAISKNGATEPISRIELKVLKVDLKAVEATAESRMKEIEEGIAQQDAVYTFGQRDSTLEENPEAIPEGIPEDSAAISEYGLTDTTLLAEGADSLNGEYEEPVDSSALAENVFLTRDSIKMEIANPGTIINSSFADYAPLISADGGTIVFTSRRLPVNAVPKPVKGKQKVPENKENIYRADYNDKRDQWRAAEAIGFPVNFANGNSSAIALSNDGMRLFIIRGGDDPKSKGDILETYFSGEYWSEPQMLPPAINSDDLETSASISPDGRTIYFVSNRKGGLGEKDIWSCTQNERGIWGEAINLGETVNTDKDEESVFIHPNGTSLFFSSKGHNSTGGYDVYISEYNDSTATWGQAEGMGTSINTPDDDLYFVMAANGKSGYYSAVRPKGLGKDDIYSITLEGNVLKRNTTIIKGLVINESGQGIKSRIAVKDKATGAIIANYTSNEVSGNYLISLPNGKNYEIKISSKGHTSYVRSIDLADKVTYNEIIKNIILETKNALLSSRVFDENGKPLVVKIEVIDKTAKQLIEKSESDSEGYSKISIPSGKKVNVFYSRPGYLFQSVNVTIPKSSAESETNLNTFTMQKLEVGKKTILNNIEYDFNQTSLRPESFLDLVRVVSLMNASPSLIIEIADHTDNSGASKENQKLSKERAKAVADRLIGMGVDKKRIKFKSYGPDQPVATNGTDEGRDLNSRVELLILKVDSKAEEITAEKRIKEELAASQEESNNPFSGESLQEKKDSVAVEKKTVDNEESVQQKEPVVIENKEENNNTEELPEKKEEPVVIENKEENSNTEELPEKKEPVVVENKENSNTEELPEKKEEPVVVENKEENNNTEELPEKKEEPVVIENKEENNNTEELPEKKEEPVVVENKEENSNAEELPEKKEEPVVVENKEESITKDPVKVEKKAAEVVNSIPEKFKKFDKDLDGKISYNEIIGVIDAFFDDDSTIVADDINAVIDYFFDN